MGSISITCSGCGQVLGHSADDPRAEVECLWCGAKTLVAARQPGPPSPPAEPPPPRARRPKPSPAAPPAPAAPARPVEEPPREPRWHEQAPYSLEEDLAGRPASEPALPPPAAPPAPRRPPPTVSPSPSEDEGSDPYQVEVTGERPCPGCGRTLAGDVVVCAACGFDRETGERRRRSYEPLHRTWEAGWPLGRRVRLFAIGQAAALPLGVLGAWVLGEWSAFLAPCLVFAAIAAFLLGTYPRTDLTRNERGKVRLTQTWRVCFFARPTQTFRLSEYEGVASAKAPAADFWDRFVLVLLVLAGVVPGFLWWYFAIRPDSFRVALTRDYGFPERTLYWGWDERQAEEMAKTLRAVAFATT